MPSIERAGATIYYEDHGDASLPALLLLAPGGLNSTIDFWTRMPIKPLDAFAGEFRLIGMDQRNAGARSKGPLVASDPWRMYAEDQLAVLDHLGVDKAQAIGSCIGSSFIFELLKLAPERIVAGIPMQPIGEDDTNPGVFGPDMWRPWGQNLIDNGATFSMDDVDAFGHGLFDPGFVFTATRDELKSFQTPLLLMFGNDRAHPRGVSEEVGKLLPNVQIIEEWKDEAVVPQVTEQMRSFLRAHQLASAR
ncbi:MAG: alpha/beta hydrolase [Chloroflexi bacterium]|nr:alpha/beta hydrolase [Chloroflexota bacterium]